MAEGFLPTARKLLGRALEATGQSLLAEPTQGPKDYVRLHRMTAVPGPDPMADDWADVVFIHGLKGSANTTWACAKGMTAPDWPTWVAQELAGLRVWCADYSSTLLPTEAHFAIHKIGANLLHQMENAGVGSSRPVVFVGHSMGGLVIKEIVHQAALSAWRPGSSVWRNTAGIAFLATPHFGSALAAPADYLARLMNLVNLDDRSIDSNAAQLRPFAHAVGQTHTAFKHHVQRRTAGSQPVSVVAYAETRRTEPVGWVVPRASADPQMASVECIELPGADHLSICKPSPHGFVPHDWLVQTLKKLRGQPTPVPHQGVRHSVFIAHVECVAGAEQLDQSVDFLAMALARAGMQVTSSLDLFRVGTGADGLRWLADRFAAADWVFVVGSPALRQAFEAGVAPGGTAAVFTRQQWQADAEARRLRRYVPLPDAEASLTEVFPEELSQRWAYLRLPLDANAPDYSSQIQRIVDALTPTIPRGHCP